MPAIGRHHVVGGQAPGEGAQGHDGRLQEEGGEEEGVLREDGQYRQTVHRQTGFQKYIMRRITLER